MSTRCELSVWATKLMSCGTVCGATVRTATSGDGRPAGGASLLPQAAASARATAGSQGRVMKISHWSRSVFEGKLDQGPTGGRAPLPLRCAMGASASLRLLGGWFLALAASPARASFLHGDTLDAVADVLAII